MGGALARPDDAVPSSCGPSAQEAVLRRLLDEARLLALNAAIESAAARESDLPGAADAAAAVERLLERIGSAASLSRSL